MFFASSGPGHALQLLALKLQLSLNRSAVFLFTAGAGCSSGREEGQDSWVLILLKDGGRKN